MGVDLAHAEFMGAEVIQSMATLARAIRGLGPLGWAVTPSQLPTTAIDEAVRLLDAGATDEAIDEHMTNAWNEGSLLRRSFAPMFMLHDGSDREVEVMLARQTLLAQALRHHVAGQNAASTLIVLTQVDGLTFDVWGDGTGAFRKGKPDRAS